MSSHEFVLESLRFEKRLKVCLSASGPQAIRQQKATEFESLPERVQHRRGEQEGRQRLWELDSKGEHALYKQAL